MTETEPHFRDDLLGEHPRVELLTEPVYELADNWRSADRSLDLGVLQLLVCSAVGPRRSAAYLVAAPATASRSPEGARLIGIGIDLVDLDRALALARTPCCPTGCSPLASGPTPPTPDPGSALWRPSAAKEAI